MTLFASCLQNLGYKFCSVHEIAGKTAKISMATHIFAIPCIKYGTPQFQAAYMIQFPRKIHNIMMHLFVLGSS